MPKYDVIIIGAGAAGLMCAIESGKRGRKTLILDHSKKVGEKIRISGGGRCNFTNIHTSPKNFISQNPYFCNSALARYTPADFIELVEKHKIKYHEKTLGQLFCDESSKLVINMLVNECEEAGVEIKLSCEIIGFKKDGDNFILKTSEGEFEAESLVIASGGLSIPKIGASGFGYDIAKQFGLNIIKPRPALVPLLLENELLKNTKEMAGLATDVIAKNDNIEFKEAMLFTHKGISGPAILQISSYLEDEESFTVNLSPELDLSEFLNKERKNNPKQNIQTIFTKILPKKLAQYICNQLGLNKNIAEYGNKEIKEIKHNLENWQVSPSGNEGYRTAEVTIGGVDTNEISSKTFEAKKVDGLYFIGEVLDVTGWLGGYNFQWAWASGHACGQYV